MQLEIDYGDWILLPAFFGTTEEAIEFTSFFKEMKALCFEYKLRIYGKEFTGRRLSTTFIDQENISHEYYYYSNFPSRPWGDSETIQNIRAKIENYLGQKFDYCLAHIYMDGNANICWHNDKEAINTIVVSISFGASRKFRLRKINETKGWEEELVLDSGDVLIMKSDCQKKYKHCVPIEKKVTEPRINLTFRQFE